MYSVHFVYELIVFMRTDVQQKSVSDASGHVFHVDGLSLVEKKVQTDGEVSRVKCVADETLMIVTHPC